MKKISLIAVILLFASVSGRAQNAKFDTIVIPDIQLSEVNVEPVELENVLASLDLQELGIDSITPASASSSSRGSVSSRSSVSSRVSVSRSGSTSGTGNNGDCGCGDDGDYRFDKGLEKLSIIDDVTAITITESLLDMMPDVNSYVEKNGVNIQKVIAKLQQIDIASSTNDEAKKIMRDVNRHLNREATVLMRVKNEKEDVVFYGTKGTKGNKSDDTIRSLILFSDNKTNNESSVLIRLKGVFNTDDIKNIIKIKGKSAK
jgi:hypothetical protein